MKRTPTSPKDLADKLVNEAVDEAADYSSDFAASIFESQEYEGIVDALRRESPHAKDRVFALNEQIKTAVSPDVWKLMLELETAESAESALREQAAYLVGIAVGRALKGGVK